MNEFIKFGAGLIRKSSISSLDKSYTESKCRVVITFDKHFMYEEFDAASDRDARFAEIEQELLA